MEVVYKLAIADKLLNAIDEADKNQKVISHFVLTENEAIELYNDNEFKIISSPFRSRHAILAKFRDGITTFCGIRVLVSE